MVIDVLSFPHEQRQLARTMGDSRRNIIIDSKANYQVSDCSRSDVSGISCLSSEVVVRVNLKVYCAFIQAILKRYGCFLIEVRDPA